MIVSTTSSKAVALRELSFRLAGITAICLGALLVPMSATERVAALTATSLGIGVASILPRFDRIVARAVGPTVFAIALVPTAGPWALLGLLGLFIVGFAAFSHRGLIRVVPALGLPVMTVVFRSGQSVEPGMLVAWLLAVLATILFSNATSSATPTGHDHAPYGGSRNSDRPDVVFRWRRHAQAVILVAVIAPMAFAGAAWFDDGLVGIVGPRALLGDPAGPALRGHPGLTGGLDVGSPVHLSDEVVLRVKADRPLFWRGTTYDHWDGRRWTSGVRTNTSAWDTQGVGLPTNGSEPTHPTAITVEQQFRLERAGLDVVLGAWRMESVFVGPQTAAIGDDGSIRLDQPLGAGAIWTVKSSVVPVSPEVLRRADPLELSRSGSAADLTPEIARYTVEDDVTPEVAELAAAITAGADSTYDKVKALEDWMDDNIVYTRDIPALAGGEDAVHHLLLESRRGFCEQIGSALVVMLRSLGIPSRLVVGYVPGEYDSTTGEWLSRGTDAHAWAEVYFPGIGWQGFDPTAGVALSGPNRAGNVDPSRWSASIPGEFRLWAGVISAVVVAAAAVVSRTKRLGWMRGSMWPTWPRSSEESDPDHLAPLIELSRRFDACGNELGLAWTDAMTLRDKACELTAAGMEEDLIVPATSLLEQLWFLDLDHLDRDELVEAIRQASTCIESLERSATVLGGEATEQVVPRRTL